MDRIVPAVSGSVSIRRVVAAAPRGPEPHSSGDLAQHELHFMKFAVVLAFDRVITKKVLTA